QLGHVRALDRTGSARALPDTAPDRRRPVRRRGGRRGAPAARGRRALSAAGGRGRPRAGGRPPARARAGRGRAVEVRRTPAERERTPRAVAIGTFDGVHRGHQSVVRAAIEAGLSTTVVTFHPHPREVLGNQVSLLATLERRLELLAALGVDETLVLEFT